MMVDGVVAGIATGTIVDVDGVVVGGCKQSWHRLMTPRHVVKIFIWD